MKIIFVCIMLPLLSACATRYQTKQMHVKIGNSIPTIHTRPPYFVVEKLSDNGIWLLGRDDLKFYFGEGPEWHSLGNNEWLEIINSTDEVAEVKVISQTGGGGIWDGLSF